MKNFFTISLFFLISGTITQACGPFYPVSYLTESNTFKEEVNVPLELLLVAKDYKIIDSSRYPMSTNSTQQAERIDFQSANKKVNSDVLNQYVLYAKNSRSGNTNAPPKLDKNLHEFILYLNGIREMKDDPSLEEPASWKKLLALPPEDRKYRTVWVEYMLGNIATHHNHPSKALEHYIACREAVKEGYIDTLGLAHASFKWSYLAQTNTLSRLKEGIRSVAYYTYTNDKKNKKNCFGYLAKDVNTHLQKPSSLWDHPLLFETAILFAVPARRFYYSPISKNQILKQLKKYPKLKTTARMAWYFYQQGEIELSKKYLKHTNPEDPLVIWIRFRLAQRANNKEETILQITKWLKAIQTHPVIIFKSNNPIEEFPSLKKIPFALLGKLLVTQGDMQAAFECLMQGEDFYDAKKIADRYLELNELKNYIDANQLISFASITNKIPISKTTPTTIPQEIKSLLARRLFRAGRIEESIPYFNAKMRPIAELYKKAIDQSKYGNANNQSAHLFHAARILRRHGMDLSATTHYPDFRTLYHGLFYKPEELLKTTFEKKKLAEKTKTNPPYCYHFVYLASEMALRASKMTWNRNQRATILWFAGNCIIYRNPKLADPYYKTLARIYFNPLAKRSREKHWFARPTPKLESLLENDRYMSPKELSSISKNYTPPK